MGGREAIRGFAIQALSAVLDALGPGNLDWIAVTIEPDVGNDKVDILWEFPGFVRAQQVKSSKNQMGKAAVQDWCHDLKASRSADQYELILAGPVAQAVIDEAPFEGVAIPIPLAIDTLALIEQAITRLDRYLLSQGLETIPLLVRESLVTLVAGSLIDGSVSGHRFTRAEFDGHLQRWLTTAYPEAIRTRLSANCEVLWSQIELHRQRRAAEPAFALVLPLAVVNGGPTVAVVEWFYLTVSSERREMRYAPEELLAPGQPTLASAPGPCFGPFAVVPNAVWEGRVLFLPHGRAGFATDRWPVGVHTLALYVKFGSVPQPRLAGSCEFTVTDDHGAIPHGGALRHSLVVFDPL